jgi:hypothetical protein
MPGWKHGAMAKTSRDVEVAARVRAAGERARAEADKRRAAQTRATTLPQEIGGPKGPEPTRYGDWERKGIVSDF